MDNAVKIVLGKQRVGYLSVGQITFYKGKPGVIEWRLQPIVLEIDVALVIEAVDAHHLVARIEQCLRNFGVNEACGAGHQIAVHMERPVFMRALNHVHTVTKC